ncbi:endonuclease [Opitutaceae bacterium EW11]|nr:endonuclease [Opitutaceae bacterium EW11]
MNTIETLYAGNVVAKTPGGPRQTLTFAVLIENLAFDKNVEVHWAGTDGNWRVLPCHFTRSAGLRHEVWEAEIHFGGEFALETLPGDVTFAFHLRMAGVDFWDSNETRNYCIKADAGIWVSPRWPLLNVRVQTHLGPDDEYLPITAAAHPWLQPKRVFVRWTADNWMTTNTSECVFWRHHWEKTHASSARNPSETGTSIWVTHLPVHDAYRVEYALACEEQDGTIWDNNFGVNYCARHDRLSLMTLNLHCCQEEDQEAKLWAIARAINDHRVDIVCLQEVAQPWNGETAFDANTAKLIRDRLAQPYQLVHDWSHRGFGIYREGCAILSRHDIELKDSCYVSPGQDENSIHSRRVVMAQVNVPHVGRLNVFSVHLSWWQDGFSQQFDRLNAWAREKESPAVAATLLLGDFNAKAGAEGYTYVTRVGGFEDQYLKAQAVFRPPGSNGRVAPDDQRIDYIFLRPGNRLDVKNAKVLFTPSDYGRVSDHAGYYAEFEPPL